MANEFRLADIGEGLTEVEVVRWLVAVGDRVTVDEPLVEVETAKSVVELPSPYAGTVLHIGAADGAVLQVGDLIAAIGDAGESWPPVTGSASPASPLGAGPTASTAGPTASTAGPTASTASRPRAAAGVVGASAAPIVGSLSEQAQDLAPIRSAGVATAPRVQALPPVRKLARELGVDLGMVAGTGPGGRITREDVLAAAQPTPAPAPAQRDPTVPANGVRRQPGAGTGHSTPVADVRRPLSGLRRTIAANLSRAWSQIPMVSAFDDIDVGRLLSARKALAEHYGKPVPLDALLVAAVLPVLRAYPEFNSTLDGDTLVLHGRHDIGLAVDTPDGLMVAVIADASGKGLFQLADEVIRLGQGARARKLPAGELTGQTFTVSNIGAIGGSGYGTPLVPPGTTAIVSMGRATDKPVVRAGQIEVAPVMPVSLSYDHRVIDGGTGRRFLAMLADVLSEPVRLLA
jgi:pyruvate/2-oxoglutarate dehydrogenase complex dihydrolipoamide acyltransferase (E2) component